MKVYHYAKLGDFNGIREGSWKTDGVPGLRAGRRMGKEDSEAFDTNAVWALLEPLPKEWTDNPHFKDTWQILTREIGNVLLEIHVPDGAEAYVIDRGHIEGFLNSKRSDVQTPEHHVFPTRGDAERAYLKSRVPLTEYVHRAGELKYSLPEVIFPRDVPADWLAVSEQQPFLDKQWDEYKGSVYGSHLLRDIQKVPELSGWIERHQAEIEATAEMHQSKENERAHEFSKLFGKFS